MLKVPKMPVDVAGFICHAASYLASKTKTVLSNEDINFETRVIWNLSLFRSPLLRSKEALGFQIIARMQIVIFL